jgi:hypothetical protein
MDPRGLAARQEPDLELDIGAGRALFSIERITGGIPTGSQLTDFIKNARSDENPHLHRYFHPDRQTGHFLIDISTNQPWPAGGAGVLDEKVVFHTNYDPPIGGNFYTSGTNKDHTMMLYVGPNGMLHGFGSYGDFRGLVYIHPDNNFNHTFQWNAAGKIDGAMLLSGGANIYWGEQNYTTTISRNDDVLATFGTILKRTDNGQSVGGSGGGDPSNRITIKPGETLRLKQLGVYFH